MGVPNPSVCKRAAPAKAWSTSLILRNDSALFFCITRAVSTRYRDGREYRVTSPKVDDEDDFGFAVNAWWSLKQFHHECHALLSPPGTLSSSAAQYCTKAEKPERWASADLTAASASCA